MRDGKDLRPVECIFFVHDCVREAIEVVDAQTIFAVWTTPLIFNKQVAYARSYSARNAAAMMLLACVA